MIQYSIIAALAQDLDRLKGWDTAYTSSNKKQMIIWLDDKAYKITAEPVEGTAKDLFRLIAEEPK